MANMHCLTQKRVGLLGGSFDPPHKGHVHISKLALKRLALDEVWWVMSPGNPLKKRQPHPFKTRQQIAQSLIKDPRITITDFEYRISSNVTYDSIASLMRNYPRHKFIWLMGSDNLVQFHRWSHWRRILEAVPVVVFSRNGYDLKGLASKAAKMYLKSFVRAGFGRIGFDRPLPAWTLIKSPTVKISSSALRE